MIGYELFQVCNAFTLHFNSRVDYDCLKYNFKTKVNQDSFNKSKLKWQYIGTEKKLEGQNIKFSVFSAYVKFDCNYVKPQQLLKALNKQQPDIVVHTFKKDLQYLKSVYNGSTDLFGIEGLYPNVYSEYANEKISDITVMLLTVFIKDVITTDNSRDIIAWPHVIKRKDNLKGLYAYFFDKQQIEQLFLDNYLA